MMQCKPYRSRMSLAATAMTAVRGPSISAGERDGGITGDVGGAEEELGLVVGEKGGVAAPLLLVEAVDLPLELGVRRDAARLAGHLQSQAHPTSDCHSQT